MADLFKNKVWEIAAKKPPKNIGEVIMENRGLKTPKAKKDFLNPPHPLTISLKTLKIDPDEIKKALARLNRAKNKKEKIYIYGDYDADGICATAILWECLYLLGFDVLPYIPERFSEGYGIRADSVMRLKKKYHNLGLVIAVDNGISAVKEIALLNKNKIDIIVCDHHARPKTKPKARAVIYSQAVCGAALSWIFSREIGKRFSKGAADKLTLELAAIGTVADQMPLIGVNRSFTKHGLGDLAITTRRGLIEIFRLNHLDPSSIGTYEINYIIAPRINAMGRIEHGIESLRLLCTKNSQKAKELADKLELTNRQRQRIVDEVLIKAKTTYLESPGQKIIILAHESYHEGVIGLAAGKLAEEFYRPAIVISKGEQISKASARSISGFNIIEAIMRFEDLLEGGGGHPMAAGFSIDNSRLDEFTRKLRALAETAIDEKILKRRLKIDCRLKFSDISSEIYSTLKQFEPFGLGNPRPLFLTEAVELNDIRLVGKSSNHLKMSFSRDNCRFWAVGFGMGEYYPFLKAGKKYDLVYSLDNNFWNGRESLELNVKDLRPPALK